MLASPFAHRFSTIAWVLGFEIFIFFARSATVMFSMISMEEGTEASLSCSTFFF